MWSRSGNGGEKGGDSRGPCRAQGDGALLAPGPPPPSPRPQVKQVPLPQAPTSPAVTPYTQVPPTPPPGSPASGAAAPAPSPAPGHPTAPPAAPPTSSCSGELGALRPTRGAWGTFGAIGDTAPLLYTTGERFPCSYVRRQLCQWHNASTATEHTLTQHEVYVRTNATAWVEAQWGQHLERSPNITLHLDEAGECRGPGRAGGHHGHHSCAVPAVKLDPPPHEMPFAKANGRLQLWLPRPQCHHGERPPPRREVRFRRVGDRSWTQVRGPRRSPHPPRPLHLGQHHRHPAADPTVLSAGDV